MLSPVRMLGEGNNQFADFVVDAVVVVFHREFASHKSCLLWLTSEKCMYFAFDFVLAVVIVTVIVGVFFLSLLRAVGVDDDVVVCAETDEWLPR